MLPTSGEKVLQVDSRKSAKMSWGRWGRDAEKKTSLHE